MRLQDLIELFRDDDADARRPHDGFADGDRRDTSSLADIVRILRELDGQHETAARSGREIEVSEYAKLRKIAGKTLKLNRLSGTTRRQSGQPVQRALQDEDGGMLIDAFRPSGAADIGLDQLPLDCRSR
jgi:hypothetical protein